MLMASAFGVLFIKHLGGSDLQAMLFGSLFFLPRILQLPISLIIAPRSGKAFMLNCWFIAGLIMVVALAVSFFPIEGSDKATWIVIIMAVSSIIRQAGSTFWFPLLHDVVPDGHRGRFFGRMRASWSTSTLVALLLAGLFLGRDPPLWRFQAVLAVALVPYFLRNVFIARVPEATSPIRDSDYADWRKYVRQILSRSEVVVFCAYFSMLGFCGGVLSTPLVLYMRHLGVPVRDNVIINGFEPLGQVLSLLLAGTIIDRTGTRRVFKAAHLVLCGACFFAVFIGWLSTPQATCLMPIVLILGGSMVASAGVACSVQLFHFAPDRGRAFFMSLTMILITLGRGLSSVAVGYILKLVPNTWTLIVLDIHFDVFQVMLATAGSAMLLILFLAAFVEDVRPSAAVTSDRASRAHLPSGNNT